MPSLQRNSCYFRTLAFFFFLKNVPINKKHQQSKGPTHCDFLLHLDFASLLQTLWVPSSWATWGHGAQRMAIPFHLLPLWPFLQRWVSHGLICLGKEPDQGSREQRHASWRPKAALERQMWAHLSNLLSAPHFDSNKPCMSEYMNKGLRSNDRSSEPTIL